jgi:hypothetical protein
MTNPAKVLAFLDVAGNWDTTLAFVMAAALAVSAAGYGAARHLARPWLAERFAIPPPARIDRRLLAGATLFGVGWGPVGLCPGPAVAALSRGVPAVYAFFAAMVAGMLVERLAERAGLEAAPAAVPARERRSESVPGPRLRDAAQSCLHQTGREPAHEFAVATHGLTAVGSSFQFELSSADVPNSMAWVELKPLQLTSPAVANMPPTSFLPVWIQPETPAGGPSPLVSSVSPRFVSYLSRAKWKISKSEAT